MKTIRVVAAIIRDGDRIFATQRGYGEFKGWWEFPGGKIEEGETPEQALVREIREKLTAEIEVGEKLTTIEYDYPEFHLSMDCFWAKVEWGVLELKEAEDSKWLRRNKLDSVKWLPADLEIIELIKNELRKHGPLVEFSYNRTSHGMMAGTGSSNGLSLKWLRDGSIILKETYSSNTANSSSEYSVKQDAAEKVREYVANSGLVDLADEEFDRVMMADNFTSATIGMTFDDHELGGDTFQHETLFCGPAGYTFGPIEKKISELLDECKNNAELLKTDGRMLGLNLFSPDNNITQFNFVMPNSNTPMNVQPSSVSAAKGTWSCPKCGSTGNTGNFCPECGAARNN